MEDVCCSNLTIFIVFQMRGDESPTTVGLVDANKKKQDFMFFISNTLRRFLKTKIFRTPDRWHDAGEVDESLL